MIKVKLYASSANELGKLIEKCPLIRLKTKMRFEDRRWVAKIEGVKNEH